ncbi:fluoride efflux transporter FluC [Furfurilactobacillus milii]|uniref:Fluoride-specific ion channel FluC n=1 Tax=Furfurilactobacillus rossiae TaxID=231049 RepID=A0A7C9IYG9_9LACO|nr:CrcB family protein [Furfurilactobacillus milii]MYV05662.1 chromosome condensation protein CrcB [Furfurilactobacillus milii]
MYKRILAVAGFAFIGGALRETLELWWPFSTNWFGTTICINIVGAFLLAMINFWVANRFALPSQIILGLGTGMIGAFTTFSSFSLEIVKLLDAGQIVIPVIYVLLSIGGGGLAAWSGQRLADRLLGDRMDGDDNV